MSEPKLVSKCCGEPVNDLRGPDALFLWGMRITYVCSKCHKPCKIESKEGGNNEKK